MTVMKLVIVMKLMMIMMFADDADCDDMATMSWGD